MFNLKRNKKSKGFTLIEILLVVGFIALAGIGVYVVYDKVQATNAANKEARDIRVILAETRSLYVAAGSNANLNQTTLIQLGVFPEHMIDRTSNPPTLKNNMGNRMMWSSSVEATANFMTATYFSVPKELCLKLITGILPDVSRIAIGAAPIVNKPDSNLPNPIPFNMEEAASRCNAPGTGNLTMRFRL